MHSLASSYMGIGRYADALKLQEATLALRKTKLGPQHPDTLAAMHSLANCMYSLGRYTDAIKLYEETLALRKTKLGLDHPDTLHTMLFLARNSIVRSVSGWSGPRLVFCRANVSS